MTATKKFYLYSIALVVVTVLLFNSCKRDDNNENNGQHTIIYGDGVIDIDGNEYITVVIGEQEWMVENLKTTRYNNGDEIPNVTNGSEWLGLTPAYSWYDNDEDAYKNAYGALYNWYAVYPGYLCPIGWRLPTDSEWSDLFKYLSENWYPNLPNMLPGAGNALKSCRQLDSPSGPDCNTSDHPRWNSHDNHYGTDTFGFSALPGGSRSPLGEFCYMGNFGYWWSSTERSTASAWAQMIVFNNSNVIRIDPIKSSGCSVRCIKIN
jgi:uncharacterized protein (TIGR02145 family)